MHWNVLVRKGNIMNTLCHLCVAVVYLFFGYDYYGLHDVMLLTPLSRTLNWMLNASLALSCNSKTYASNKNQVNLTELYFQFV